MCCALVAGSGISSSIGNQNKIDQKRVKIVSVFRERNTFMLCIAKRIVTLSIRANIVVALVSHDLGIRLAQY
jgi:hypothetical protein